MIAWTVMSTAARHGPRFDLRTAFSGPVPMTGRRGSSAGTPTLQRFDFATTEDSTSRDGGSWRRLAAGGTTYARFGPFSALARPRDPSPRHLWRWHCPGRRGLRRRDAERLAQLLLPNQLCVQRG